MAQKSECVIRVQSLAECAFEGSSIEQVYVCNTVTSFGARCFADCRCLCSVIFESGSRLVEIGDSCFGVALELIPNRIHHITIPAAVERLGINCFQGCENLQSIDFEPSSRLREISRKCFAAFEDNSVGVWSDLRWRTNKIEAIILPASVRTLHEECFYHCTYLKYFGVEQKSCLERIGDSAFEGSGLTRIVIPESVVYLGAKCFRNCKSLKQTEFEGKSNISCIGAKCFYGSGINSLVVPLSCEDIGRACFALCELDSVAFCCEGRIQTFPVQMFHRSGISCVIVPNSVQIIGEQCFYECRDLECVEFMSNSKIQRIEKWAFRWSGIKEIEIPSGIQFISGDAFAECDISTLRISNRYVEQQGFLIDMEHSLICSFKRLTMITIPHFVENIGPLCFSWCDYLESVEFETGSCLREIADGAFARCNLAKIVLPDTVEVVGPRCFCFCTFLRSIEFGTHSKLRRIDEEAFYWSGLRDITIPLHLTDIAVGAFFWCDIDAVRIDPRNTHFSVDHSQSFLLTFDGQQVISCLRRLESLEIPTTVCTLGFRCFSEFESNEASLFMETSHILSSKGCESDRIWIGIRSVQIPQSVRVIGKECFYLCSTLHSVDFDSQSHLEIIEESAFAECGLREIRIPISVKTIGPKAFSECRALRSVDFGEKSRRQITNIGERAFERSGLESFVIPNTLINLGKQCFKSCEFLAVVEFEEGGQLDHLEEELFANSGLKRLVIPPEISFMAETAFLDCLFEEFEIDSRNQYYSFEDGCISHKDI